MSYDTVVAYARFAFVVVNMKAVLNYISARELWHAQRHLDGMHCAVQPWGCTIIYFIRLHTEFILFSVSSFYRSSNSSAVPKTCYTRNISCSLFLISLILSFILSQNSVYLKQQLSWSVSTRVTYLTGTPPEYLCACFQVRTKNGRCPKLLTFQHVAWPGCSVNLVVNFRYFGLLVV